MPKSLIQPHWALHNGQYTWRVIVPIGLRKPGYPQRRHFSPGSNPTELSIKQARKLADKFCSDLEKERGNSNARFAGLPMAVQSATMMALDLLGDGNGQEIFEAAKAHVAKRNQKQKNLADVVAECVADKAAANCRQAYLGPFENMLLRFSSHCGPRLMSEVSLDQVKAFINAPKVRAIKGKPGLFEDGPAGVYARRNRRTDLSTLFSYAMKHGYCAENLPKKLEKIRIDENQPGVLSVDDAAKLLKKLQEPDFAHLLAFTVLGLFGGLRPSEAQRLEWKDIGQTEIRVAAERGKKRANRFATINPTLRLWLDHAKKLESMLPIPEPTSRRVRTILKEMAPGFKWPRNGLRHSFSSYSFAIHGGRETAKDAGHSEDMMHKTYKQVVTKTDAESFWKLRPEI